MKKLGYITQEEKDNLAATPVVTSKGQTSNKKTSKYQSWFIDYVIDDVIQGLMDEYGWDKATASKELYSGGYRIYATVDNNIQSAIEEYYENPDNFPQMRNEVQPDSAFVVLNYSGEIVGIVGGKGEKEGSRLFNIASSGKRHIGLTAGSTMPVCWLSTRQTPEQFLPAGPDSGRQGGRGPCHKRAPSPAG